MPIQKSTRHHNIIGHFGELAVCNWLSRSGFEVARVDHTGIDIIASRRDFPTPLGITVKSRTRQTTRTENDPINVFHAKRGDRQKVAAACKAFRCEPWIAIYVETEDRADIFLTSLENYSEKYCRAGRAIEDWKMRQQDRERYGRDEHVKHIEIKFDVRTWWKPV